MLNEESTFQKLIDALTRNADEMEKLNDLLAPEMSRTETINRLAMQKLEADADAELFTRGLQLQLSRRNNNGKSS